MLHVFEKDFYIKQSNYSGGIGMEWRTFVALPGFSFPSPGGARRAGFRRQSRGPQFAGALLGGGGLAWLEGSAGAAAAAGGIPGAFG